MNREITQHDANKFWEYFSKEYPKLANQLQNQRALINGSIVSFRPATMSEYDYEEYNKVLYTWQIDNGFWEEITLMTDKQKEITFLRTSLNKLEPIDDTKTLITISGKNGVEQFLILEDMESLKRRLYI